MTHLRHVLLAGCMAACFAAPATAGDAPSFLADGQVYVSDIEACTPANDSDYGGLQLTRKGLFGYEFGCTFVDFQDVPDVNGGEDVHQSIATAACGDDSGISRPDMLLLMPSGQGSVFVTSQNDFSIQMTWERDEPSGVRWLVQREFLPCPK